MAARPMDVCQASTVVVRFSVDITQVSIEHECTQTEVLMQSPETQPFKVCRMQHHRYSSIIDAYS